MLGKKFSYKSDSIEITYDSKLCIHAAECTKGLPEVFDIKKKPWVNPDGAENDKIAKVIHKCPSGALQYIRNDGGRDETPAADSKIITVPNGPIYISGDIDLNFGDQKIKETRASLCRCGKSKNKPFCDNTHQEIDFYAE